MDMYTLLYFKWITNKDPQDSTWNSIQCYVVSLDGRRVWGRMVTCICMVESICCSPETIPTLLTVYTPIQNKKFKKKKKKAILKYTLANLGDIYTD